LSPWGSVEQRGGVVRLNVCFAPIETEQRTSFGGARPLGRKLSLFLLRRATQL
jgi:hypothetical protein